MLLSTQGLVLHTTKYGETSVITKVFTRQLGVETYIVKGVRSPKGRTKQNMLQPLSHLDMTVYNNPKKEMQYIKEMRPASQYNSIAGNGSKMAMLFFIDELLYKSLKENEPNTPLFDYITLKLKELNEASPHQMASMPIDIMIDTASHLGIAPMDNYSVGEPLFNLKEGRFLSPPSAFAVATDPNTSYFLDASASNNLHRCLSSSRQPADNALNAKQRSETLNHLLEYYHIHLSDFHNFKSHEVLHSVLR